MLTWGRWLVLGNCLIFWRTSTPLTKPCPQNHPSCSCGPLPCPLALLSPATLAPTGQPTWICYLQFMLLNEHVFHIVKWGWKLKSVILHQKKNLHSSSTIFLLCQKGSSFSLPLLTSSMLEKSLWESLNLLGNSRLVESKECITCIFMLRIWRSLTNRGKW